MPGNKLQVEPFKKKSVNEQILELVHSLHSPDLDFVYLCFLFSFTVLVFQLRCLLLTPRDALVVWNNGSSFEHSILSLAALVGSLFGMD